MTQESKPKTGPGRKAVADALKTAAAFHLFHYGFSVAFELGVMPWGARRADVVANKISGSIVIAEVKSSLADFRADTKWHEYLPYCDKFLFCVTEDLYAKIKKELPPEVGVICLSPTTGYAYVAKKCPVSPMDPEVRLQVLARLAYRNGDLSRRTTRARQRVFLDGAPVPDLDLGQPKARKSRKRKSWAKDKRRSKARTTKTKRKVTEL